MTKKRSLVSGGLAAILIVALSFISMLVFPLALNMPKWIEAELVLGSWWFLWGIILSMLLFRGWEVEDDYTKADHPRDASAHVVNVSDIGDAFGYFSHVDGFVGFILSVMLSLFVFLGVFVLMQSIFPFFIFLGYFIILKMLRTVANDEHGCESHVFKSAAWGFFWATLYMAPLMATVWGIHYLIKLA